MRRLIYQNAKGKLYEVIDWSAPISKYEWRRVVSFLEKLIDLAANEGVDPAEIFQCFNEQVE